ncbi:hypothetical protein PC116_g14279 [Phytophthora cactorum]|nr:hypothetical protein PC116_g14279 [Phytophthora cactorum]
MGAEPTVDNTEAIVAHVEDAKAMRAQYKADCEAATSEKIVTTIDYAQNIALPHSAQTPSMWYFLSLISVHVFGIHSHPDKLQWNLIYSERKAKKELSDFEVRDGEPGVVYCRTRPDSEPVVQNLSAAAQQGKIHDIHKKVLQYVPPDLRSDPLYIVPDAADRVEVAATKRFRRQKAVQKKKRPAANADAPRKKRAAESDNQ